MQFVQALQKPVLYLMIAILVFNMSQRSHQKYGEKKRFATLNMGLILLLFNGSIAVILHYNLPQYYLIFGAAIAGLAAWIMRSKTFIFKFRCPECGHAYSFKDVLYRDAPACDACGAGKHDEIPDSVDGIDWESWTPRETAVLCFIRDGNKLLLINKKTGLGAGKVNAPGGRIEEGEQPRDAAVRETAEETGLTPAGLVKQVILHFQFKDGYSLKGHVYTADSCSGEMTETDEADPFWCSVDEIPFDRMWADDILWVPGMLDGKKMKGWFIFDGDTMVDQKIEEDPSL